MSMTGYSDEEDMRGKDRHKKVKSKKHESHTIKRRRRKSMSDVNGQIKTVPVIDEHENDGVLNDCHNKDGSVCGYDTVGGKTLGDSVVDRHGKSFNDKSSTQNVSELQECTNIDKYNGEYTDTGKRVSDHGKYNGEYMDTDKIMSNSTNINMTMSNNDRNADSKVLNSDKTGKDRRDIDRRNEDSIDNQMSTCDKYGIV